MRLLDITILSREPLSSGGLLHMDVPPRHEDDSWAQKPQRRGNQLYTLLFLFFVLYSQFSRRAHRQGLNTIKMEKSQKKNPNCSVNIFRNFSMQANIEQCLLYIYTGNDMIYTGKSILTYGATSIMPKNAFLFLIFKDKKIYPRNLAITVQDINTPYRYHNQIYML